MIRAFDGLANRIAGAAQLPALEAVAPCGVEPCDATGTTFALDPGMGPSMFSGANEEVVVAFDHEPFAFTTALSFTAAADFINVSGFAADGSGLRRVQPWGLAAK